MGERAVEAVSGRRAGRASRLPVRTEHEVVDDQLRAAVKHLRQRLGPVLGLERVLLLDRHPGKLPALSGELIAHPRELFLARKQRGARSSPLLTSCGPVLWHRLAPPSPRGARYS